MVKVDTIEGVIGDSLWLHYDMENDVLYLRHMADREVAAYSEETEQGIFVVRRQDDDQVAGLTIVNAWKRCGVGPLPDSIQELSKAFSPWAEKLAAA